MPQIAVLDEHNHVVGTETKENVHEQGLKHRAFSVLILDSQGRMLIQQRSDSRFHSGGLWSNACCGHPAAHANIEFAAKVQLEQELGFTCDLNYLETIDYQANLDNGIIENEQVEIFVGVYEGIIVLDSSKVKDFRFLTLEQIKDDMRGWPEGYTTWFKGYIEQVSKRVLH